MSKNLTALAKRQGIDHTLFQELAIGEDSKSKAQRKALAKELLIGEAVVHGTASFYDFIDGDKEQLLKQFPNAKDIINFIMD